MASKGRVASGLSLMAPTSSNQAPMPDTGRVGFHLKILAHCRDSSERSHPTSGHRRFSTKRLYCWDSQFRGTGDAGSDAGVRCMRAQPPGPGCASSRQQRNRWCERALCHLDLRGRLCCLEMSRPVRLGRSRSRAERAQRHPGEA